MYGVNPQVMHHYSNIQFIEGNNEKKPSKYDMKFKKYYEIVKYNYFVTIFDKGYNIFCLHKEL